MRAVVLMMAMVVAIAAAAADDDDDKQLGYCPADGVGDTDCAKDAFQLIWLRFDGIKVGETRTVTVAEEEHFDLRLMSNRPLLYEIDNFLTAQECTEIVTEARKRGLKQGYTQKAADSDGQIQLMDADHDKQLSIAEMRRTLEVNYDAHFKDSDVRQMYQTLRLDPNGDEFVTPQELGAALPAPKQLAEYVIATMQADPTLKGRNSEHMFFFPDREQNNVIQRVADRVARLLKLPQSLLHKSDMQIVHYETGGHYNVHLDSSGADRGSQQQEPYPCCDRFGHHPSPCRACRWATVLFYLNDVEAGGETAFPLADDDNLDVQKFHADFRENLHVHCDSARLKVQPKMGKAVLWYNHLPPSTPEQQPWFGDIDQYSHHGSCPVQKGEKWIANFWIKVSDDKEWDLRQL